MNKWLQLLFFFILVGSSKAASFIKLVILAGLGLAGLWMVHTLAQDYDKISHNFGSNLGKLTQNIGFASAGRQEDDEPKLFLRSTRSVDGKEQGEEPPEINWELVLSRDPASCARSFICQLAAQDETKLNQEERTILDLTSYSAQKDNWASKQLQEAFKNGYNANSPNQCRKIYKYCPYSSTTMLNLIRFFG